MRTLGGSLQAAIATGTTTLCRLFTITRTSGQVLRFTDFDGDVTFDGNVYSANSSISITNVSTAIQGGVTSTNAKVILDAEAGVSSVDFIRGRYDGATFKVSWVDWSNPSLGEIIILIGQISIIEATNKGTGSFEVRGILNRGDMRIGQFYTPECTADLGDARCTVDLTPTLMTGTVAAVSTRTKISVDLSGDPADAYFSFGVLTWTSGNNLNQSIEILSQAYVSGHDQLVLALEMPDDIEVGDTFDIVAGCDKTRGTCQTKFSNIANYRGYPFVPGPDGLSDSFI